MKSVPKTAVIASLLIWLIVPCTLRAQTAPATQPARGGRGPAPLVPANPNLHTLWIASDSTAANGARGWGDHMQEFLDTSKINIINGARSGQSSRTFQSAGSWKRITDGLKKGDYVLIQFGHNDNTDVKTTDPIRQRGTIPTLGEETVETNGQTVHTFGWYMRKMVAETKAKEATPIIVSMTVRNEWKDGKVERGFGPFASLSIQLAKDEKIEYVDLNNIVADVYDSMGPDKVKPLFGTDTTHTIAEGGQLNAQSVVSGLRALKDHPFDAYLTEKGKAVEANAKYTPK